MLIRNDFAENWRPILSSITWNKPKESLFVNSEEIIWTRPFKI